jgi:predicted permease
MSITTGRAGDVWLAVRRLRRAPIYTLSVVAIVALGIGVAALVGSVANALLLRPVAGLTEPDRLFNVHRLEGETPPALDFESFSYAGYRELQRATDAAGITDGVVAFLGTGVSYRAPSAAAARMLGAQLVSQNYFEVLGVRPELGIFFEPAAADLSARADQVVVGHGFWQRELGGARDALGKVLLLNGRPYAVVGVAPEGFLGTFLGFPFDLWVPLAAAAEIAPGSDLGDAGDHLFELTARLAPGMTHAAAGAAMRGIGSALIAEGSPRSWPRPGGLLAIPFTGLEDSLASAVRAFLAILAAAALALLAVVAVNAAGLVAARSAERVPELAVRAALGASRRGLAQHLLIETVLLFVAGGAVGLAVAHAGTGLLDLFSPPGPIPLRLDAAPDWTVATLAFVLAASAGLAAGVAPALMASRAGLASSMAGSRGVVSGVGSRFRRGLVVAQVALTLTLMVGAGLFLRTLTRAAGTDLGFDPSGLWMTELTLQLLGEDEGANQRRLDAIVATASSISGVTEVTLADSLPLGFGRPRTQVRLASAGPAAAGGEATGWEVGFNRVAPGYFATLRLPLLAGRSFTAGDDREARAVAIVNHTFARRFLAVGENPAAALGGRFFHDDREVEVVGVARDSKVHRPWEDPQPHLYRPLAQASAGRPELVVRIAEGGGEAVAGALLAALWSTQPDLPVERPYPLGRHLRIALLPQRIAAAVAGALGSLGLTLSALGLYALLAFAVSRRGRELAVRQALGASPASVRALVLREGLGLAGAGALLGLALAAGGSRALGGFLHGVGTFDLAAFAGAVLALLGVALLAILVPARRASRIQPATALREQ